MSTHEHTCNKQAIAKMLLCVLLRKAVLYSCVRSQCMFVVSMLCDAVCGSMPLLSKPFNGDVLMKDKPSLERPSHVVMLH